MNGNLLHFLRFCKNEILIILAIFLLALGSFGLGRLSVRDDMKQSVKLVDLPLANTVSSLETARVAGTQENVGGTINGGVVASKNGSKYHFPWCQGASQISEKNKIVFSSEAEAIKAGFTRASNCK